VGLYVGGRLQGGVEGRGVIETWVAGEMMVVVEAVVHDVQHRQQRQVQ